MHRVAGWVLMAAVAAAAAGCGAKGVAVDGKVVDGGTPHALGEGESISLTLTSDDGKTTGSGSVEKDGSFHVKKSDGTPLPAGKYKVSVIHYHMPAGGKGPPAPPTPVDIGESWDVSEGNKSFTIDLSKLKKEKEPKKK